jgi:hypothetical protein
MVEDVPLERTWGFPSRWTFEIDPISNLLEEEMGDGIWVDPFAGKNSPADITNDLHPDRETDYTMDAVEFLKMFDDDEIDGGILLDPPYNKSAVKTLYDNIGKPVEQDDTNAAFYGRPRDEASRILQTGAKAISLGWNSNGCSQSRGFYKKRILLVAHGSARNDTICVVEVRNERRGYTPEPEHDSASEANW